MKHCAGAPLPEAVRAETGRVDPRVVQDAPAQRDKVTVGDRAPQIRVGRQPLELPRPKDREAVHRQPRRV